MTVCLIYIHAPSAIGHTAEQLGNLARTPEIVRPGKRAISPMGTDLTLWVVRLHRATLSGKRMVANPSAGAGLARAPADATAQQLGIHAATLPGS